MLFANFHNSFLKITPFKIKKTSRNWPIYETLKIEIFNVKL